MNVKVNLRKRKSSKQGDGLESPLGPEDEQKRCRSNTFAACGDHRRLDDAIVSPVPVSLVVSAFEHRISSFVASLITCLSDQQMTTRGDRWSAEFWQIDFSVVLAKLGYMLRLCLCNK